MNKSIFLSEQEILLGINKLSNISDKDILDKIKKTDLRGLGGAGFPTWIKWNASDCSLSSKKYVVVNGHEGEPFTLKDKFLMQNFPFQVIAGAIIAAQVISAEDIFIVINKNYKEEFKALQNAISKIKKECKLKNLSIKILTSKDKYIGGEETAMLNEIEGKRIEPRRKDPLVCDKGLYGSSTIINNVETFLHAAFITFGNYKEYKNLSGKMVTVSGDVKNPGVYAIKFREKLADVIKKAGGVKGKLKFAIVGGFSGNVVMTKNLNNLLSFDRAKNSIFLGSGTIIVYNQRTKALDILKNLFEFYKNESCGQCVPCREGTRKLFDIVLNSKNKIKKEDKEKIDEILFALDNSSFCVFGQCVGMAAKGIFENFGKEVLGAK